MCRITRAFAQKAKIVYLTAGDDGVVDENCLISMSNSVATTDTIAAAINASVEYFLALVKSGVNILEIGVPFSDPVADGATIQLAMTRALKNGINFNHVLEIVKRVRDKSEVALVLFTYYNPICINLAEFLSAAKMAGADGILVVDLPLEESDEFSRLCRQIGLAHIMVASASTSLERTLLLSRNGSGFLYYACRRGTTGVRNDLADDLIARIKQVKESSDLPVAVGFGVSNNNMVQQILSIADGCVVGSYFVDKIAKGISPQNLGQMAGEMFNVD